MSRDIKQVLAVRNYKKGDYHTVKYIIDGSQYGGEDLIMTSAFTNNTLDYIGDSKWAHRLANRFGLTQLQTRNPRRTIQKRNIVQEAKRLLAGEFMTDYSFSPVVCIGFNEEEQKWYGWSHRAIYGFGIGSKVEPGHVAYKPYNKEDFIKDSIRFWTEDYHHNTYYAGDVDEMGRPAALIKWIYSNDVPNEKLRGQEGYARAIYPDEWGKGTWVATTLAEAKQMAIDFAEGVS